MKILYKALFPNLYDGIIASITQLETNRFEVIHSHLPDKNKDKIILDVLKKMGFYNDDEDLRVVNTFHIKVDTWACIKTIVKFWDWGFERYKL